MNQIIKEIHSSDMFGAIIEVGCGVPVASNLLNVSGASKTVYVSECPYSMDYQHATYHNTGSRAVSAESVQAILSSDRWKELNTVYVASFQVGDETNAVSTHGWIGLRYKETVLYYHVSLHQPATREEYVKQIGEIGIHLLFNRNEDVFENGYVDAVLDSSLQPLFNKTVDFIAANENEQMCVFTKQGTIERLEYITRTNKELLLYRGSFNPVQNAHVAAAKTAEGLYPESNLYFCLSTNVYEKGQSNTDSLMRRVHMLHLLGYDVIVCSKPLFKSTLDFVRHKFSGEVVFVLGLDTMERLYMHYDSDTTAVLTDFTNTSFVLVNRSDSADSERLTPFVYMNRVRVVKDFAFNDSSTQVREALANKRFDVVKKLVPAAIYNDIIQNA